MALLAGCSSGDDLLAEQPAVPAAESLDDENLSREDLMGDVPIEKITVASIKNIAIFRTFEFAIKY